MSLEPGRQLGPYEVLAPLGAGGMGEVYRANDTRLDRTVALKVLPSELSANPDLRARFEREAKAISGSDHPHICTLHDVGQDDGIDYLVMEYLEGETLADRLKKGPLPLEQALKCAIEIADALDTAHRQGVVHRDLKPGNVMLTKTGAKLLDFGLAKLREGDPSDPATSASAIPTEHGPSPRTGRSSARSSTWPRSSSRGRTRTPAPTSSPSARCCTRWRRAAGPSTGRARPASSPPSWSESRRRSRRCSRSPLPASTTS